MKQFQVLPYQAQSMTMLEDKSRQSAGGHHYYSKDEETVMSEN